MDEKLLHLLETYLKENYQEPVFQGYFQTAPSQTNQGTEEKKTVSLPSSEYYYLELNLPPLKDTFATYLFRLIHLKGKEESEVYKKANIDRRLFSKIRTNKDYTPSKATILALIFALELDIAEAEDLLERAGYCLSRSKKGDVIIQFFIQNHMYDLFTVQEALSHYGMKMLGS